MSNIRWGVNFSIFAFILSVALGFISGVSLLYIFLRALVFTAIFFGIGVGLRSVIATFFPEILFYDEDAPKQESSEKNGTILDITLGASAEYAVPEMYKDSNDTQEIGNIEDLLSGAYKTGAAADEYSAAQGIDRMPEAGYNNEEGGFSDFFNVEETQPSLETQPAKPVFTPSFGDEAGMGGLPDLDVMARAFSPGYSAGPHNAPDYSASSAPAFNAAASNALPSASSFEPSSFTPDVSFDSYSSFGGSPPEVNSYKSSYNKGNKSQALEGDFDPRDLAEGIRTILNKDK